MEDAMLMQVDQSLQDLVKETLCLSFLERLVSMCSHVLLQIILDILKNQIQLLLGIDDLFQPK